MPKTKTRPSLKLIVPTETKQHSYVCDDCSMCFKRKKELLDHELDCVKKPFSCKMCGKRFEIECHVDLHFRFVHGPKKFICEEGCGKTFTRESDLISHYIIHVKDKPFSCRLCGKRFKLKQFYKTHVKVHETATYIPAEEMEGKRRKRKVSTSDSDDEEESTIRKKVKVFTCDICHENFTKNFNLKRHRSTHSKKKIFCVSCKPTVYFDDIVARKEHYDTFHCGKPFKCEVCNCAFAQKLGLTRHELSHVSADVYPCYICDATFTRMDNLKKHQKSYHVME